MRAFLRADPDIIMVGEMRDKETTAIGIEASLTGHLVFATLHTNSAPESIIRLLDMGMDPFNFADALLGVLAQRLAKRLCGKCKQPHPAGQEEIKLLLEEYCQELKNTDDLEEGPEGRLRGRSTGSGPRASPTTRVSSPCTRRSAARRAAAPATRAVSACTSCCWARDPIKKLIQEHARVAEMLGVGAQRRHAHPEAGRRGEGAAGRHRHAPGARCLHQVTASRSR